MSSTRSPHRTALQRRRDDELCAALIGMLCHLTDTLATWVLCAGCGTLADPAQPCPTCARRRKART